MALISIIKQIRNFNYLERAAVSSAVEAVGPLIEKFGTDLSVWTPEQAEEFIRQVWIECGENLRQVIREGKTPF